MADSKAVEKKQPMEHAIAPKPEDSDPDFSPRPEDDSLSSSQVSDNDAGDEHTTDEDEPEIPRRIVNAAVADIHKVLAHHGLSKRNEVTQKDVTREIGLLLQDLCIHGISVAAAFVDQLLSSDEEEDSQ